MKKAAEGTRRTQEAERRRGTHTRTEETWWLQGEERNGGGQVPALHPTWGGGGAAVETIWIPRSNVDEHEVGWGCVWNVGCKA